MYTEKYVWKNMYTEKKYVYGKIDVQNMYTEKYVYGKNMYTENMYTENMYTENIIYTEI